MNILRTCHLKSGYFTIPPEMLRATPECLDEKYCNVTNHDSGLRRILFDLSGARDLVVDGGGGEFQLNGRMIPFWVSHAENVTFRNFTLDWERPMHTQARVTASAAEVLELEFPPDMPVRVENRRLLFYGPHYESAMHLFHYSKIIEINPERRETEYKILPNLFDREGNRLDLNCFVEQTGERTFRIHGKFESVPKPGNVVVFVHEWRTSPGFVLERCRNIRFEDVTLRHAGGMGITAQNSRDIVLERLRVTPGAGRLFSVCYDATHFVDCSGKIVIKDCFFENQFDDHTNIHGTFRPVIGRIAPDTLLTGTGHPQQKGVETLEADDIAGFYDRVTFAHCGDFAVASVEKINNEHSLIRFRTPLPEMDFEKMCVMRVDHSPEVEISGSTFRGNRSRGLLLSTLGKVRVHHNSFHVPMAGIKISGDMNSWFESGPVEDIEIYENSFDCCNYGTGSRALFEIDPEVRAPYLPTGFHKNIRIHHNRIRYFEEPLFFSRCSADALQMYDNQIEKIAEYPPAD